MRLATARAAPPADRFVAAEATMSALISRLPSAETARISHSDLETLLEQVAAVYTIPPFVRTAEDIIRERRPADAPAPVRPRPEGKRVWASLVTEPAEIIPSCARMVSWSPAGIRRYATRCPSADAAIQHSLWA
jgi:hypothetical protein